MHNSATAVHKARTGGGRAMRDEPSTDHPGIPDSPEGQRIWGPSPVLTIVAALVTVGTAAWLLVALSPEDKVFAGLLTIFAATATLGGLMMRRRLIASTAGLRVGTLFGAKLITWSQVHRIQITTRRHLGIGAEMLHLDLDEDGLFIFGRIDLGAEPEEVAEELRRLKLLALGF